MSKLNKSDIILKTKIGESIVKENLYYKKLDLIRILACVLVLLYHLDILKGGFLAVCLFYVLSGYLATKQAIKNNNFSIKSYYLNRIKRLYIPLVIVTFITVIIVKLFPIFSWINLRNESLSVLFGYNNFWQISANADYFVRNVESPFKHMWFISILMQFDLVFPLIAKLFKKISEKAKHISIVYVVLLTIGSLTFLYFLNIFGDINTVYYNTFSRVFSLLFGVLLALINSKYNTRFFNSKSIFNNLFFILYTVLLIICCVFVPDNPFKYALFMILTTIISTRLIEYATTKNGKNNALNKPIRYIAKITYDVYLVHYPIIYFMQKSTLNYGINLAFTITMILLSSIVLYLFTDYRIKNKVIRIIKYIIISLIIIAGSVCVLISADYAKDMDELQEVLAENELLTEKNNAEFMSNNTQQVEYIVEPIIIQSGEDLSGESIEESDELNYTDEEIEAMSSIVKALPVVGIGDSVLLGAADEFYRVFPNGYFDGKVSRTIKQAEEIIIGLKDEGKLEGPLILALANNGDYSDYRNKELMNIVGDKEVYWVNAVLADDPEFNDKFKEFAKDYPNIHIVDWVEESNGHDEYFYGDGIHLKLSGSKAYVNVVFNAILDQYLKNTQ